MTIPIPYTDDVIQVKMLLKKWLKGKKVSY